AGARQRSGERGEGIPEVDQVTSRVRPAVDRDRARRPIGAGGTPALLLLALLACHREAPRIAAQKPDIILVTIDTLRADSLGFAGNARVKTPFLDRMAAEGIVFTNAHSQNVITLPSHTNILTGLYPYQHGVRENEGFRLDAKFETIATMLRRAGYATGAFV